MYISQKCLYAMRAIFELSLREDSEPVKINKIADAQNIPPRFLEIILNQLKHAGFVESKRGKQGGYVLSCSPDELNVGEIIKTVQGSIDMPSKTFEPGGGKQKRGDYAFNHMWESLRKAVSSIYNNTSFSDLIRLEDKSEKPFATNFSI